MSFGVQLVHTESHGTNRFLLQNVECIEINSLRRFNQFRVFRGVHRLTEQVLLFMLRASVLSSKIRSLYKVTCCVNRSPQGGGDLLLFSPSHRGTAGEPRAPPPASSAGTRTTGSSSAGPAPTPDEQTSPDRNTSRMCFGSDDT